MKETKYGGIMARVVSKESIRRANDNVKSGKLNNINIDSRNVSVSINTTFGTKDITISKKTISDTARSVYKDSKSK